MCVRSLQSIVPVLCININVMVYVHSLMVVGKLQRMQMYWYAINIECILQLHITTDLLVSKLQIRIGFGNNYGLILLIAV